MEVEELRVGLLKIIVEHNATCGNRILEPINKFGEPLGGLRLFWANWNDDELSTHTFGITYDESLNNFRIFGSEDYLPIGEIQLHFLKTINTIPKLEN